jgi:hypothetical protein
VDIKNKKTRRMRRRDQWEGGEDELGKRVGII